MVNKACFPIVWQKDLTFVFPAAAWQGDGMEWEVRYPPVGSAARSVQDQSDPSAENDGKEG